MIWIIILALCMVMGTEIMLWNYKKNKLQKQEDTYTDLLEKLSEEYKETVDGIFMNKREQQLEKEFEDMKREVAEFEKLCKEYNLKAKKLKLMMEKIEEEKVRILNKIEQQLEKEKELKG